MKVLGIDPGYDRLGIAIMEKSNGKEVILHSECFLTEKENDIASRLDEIGEHIIALMNTHTLDALAIETLYFNTNQKTAIAVAEARGVLLYLAKKHGCAVFEYTPQQIKVAVTGHGKSTKQQMMEMVRRLTGFQKKGALDDEYDAIAIGMTCLACEREPFKKHG